MDTVNERRIIRIIMADTRVLFTHSRKIGLNQGFVIYKINIYVSQCMHSIEISLENSYIYEHVSCIRINCLLQKFKTSIGILH